MCKLCNSDNRDGYISNAKCEGIPEFIEVVNHYTGEDPCIDCCYKYVKRYYQKDRKYVDDYIIDKLKMVYMHSVFGRVTMRKKTHKIYRIEHKNKLGYKYIAVEPNIDLLISKHTGTRRFLVRVKAYGQKRFDTLEEAKDYKNELLIKRKETNERTTGHRLWSFRDTRDETNRITKG